MSAIDRDALICDFAQYYHLNLDEQPVRYAAILACGLPADSRIQCILRAKKEETRLKEEELKRKTATETKNNELIFNSPEAFMEARAKFQEE